MVCRHCSSEIPEGQSICPSCYASVNLKQREAEVKEPPKTSVLAFSFDTVKNNLFLNRMEKYLQPDRVAWAWVAETPQQFINITNKSSFTWGLLIVGAEFVSQQLVLLNDFLANNRQVFVGVQYERKQNVPASSPIAGAVLFVSPSEIDEWLTIMHTLLNLADDKHFGVVKE
jgi:hypothetical protein